MDSFSNDGLRFDVVDSGPQDGRVVVLLHGFPQRASSWQKVTPHLEAAGFRCLAPDQRGYSPGARPTGRRAYRLDRLVADVLALVDATGRQQVHLVGHDWGAAVAWSFAQQHADRLASLTAFSVPHPAAFRAALLRSRQVLASWYMYAFQLPLLPERYLPNRLQQHLEATGQAPDAAARDAAAMAAPGALGPALNWYRAIPFSDPRQTTVPVDVPSLFVWSDGDTAVTRASADRCADRVRGEFRYEVLAGVSHWIPDEAPETAARLLMEHLEAHPGG